MGPNTHTQACTTFLFTLKWVAATMIAAAVNERNGGPSQIFEEKWISPLLSSHLLFSKYAGLMCGYLQF